MWNSVFLVALVSVAEVPDDSSFVGLYLYTCCEIHWNFGETGFGTEVFADGHCAEAIGFVGCQEFGISPAAFVSSREMSSGSCSRRDAVGSGTGRIFGVTVSGAIVEERRQNWIGKV